MAHIYLTIHAHQRHCCTGTRTLALVVPPPASEPLVLRGARCKVRETIPRAPILVYGSEKTREMLWRRHPRTKLRERPIEHERGSPFRVGRGEQHAHGSPLGHTEHGRPLVSRVLHHCTQIIHAYLEGRDVRHAVGESCATLVEENETRERR